MKLLLCAFFVISDQRRNPRRAAASAHAPAASAADQAQAVRGSNLFAADLYAHLRTQPGNLFFSPESISTAFAMTYAGASGDTASQMAQVFHFTLPPDRLHPAMGELLSQMNPLTPVTNCTLPTRSGRSRAKTSARASSRLSRSDYAAGFHLVNFRAAPDAVRGDINQWIEKQTNDKIKDMLGPGSITPITRLVLTNAIYFKGSWVQSVPAGATRAGRVPRQPGAIRAGRLHAPHRRLQYLDGGTFQAIELPYQGNDLSMVILLPKQIDGLAALERSFTAAAFSQWMQNFHFAEPGDSQPAALHHDPAVRAQPDSGRDGHAPGIHQSGRFLRHVPPLRTEDIRGYSQGIRRRE